VATHTARAAEKLRAQGSVTEAIHVFLQTNRFKPKQTQYEAGLTLPLPLPSSDTLLLTKAALAVLAQIYRPGYRYQKAGVMLLGLQSMKIQQLHVFEKEPDGNRQCLMQTLDEINRRMGHGTLRLAGAGMKQRWKVQAEHKSACYTTRWSELPMVLAG